MKTKTFEYKITYYAIIGILLCLVFGSCKKPEPIVPNKPLGASWEGYYTDAHINEYCTSMVDSVHIYYDNYGQLFIDGLDLWTCNQPLPLAFTNNQFTMDTYYYLGASFHIEATGFWDGDTIKLTVHNHLKDGGALPPITLHKYYKK